jgi:hypothetical protein
MNTRASLIVFVIATAIICCCDVLAADLDPDRPGISRQDVDLRTPERIRYFRHFNRPVDGCGTGRSFETIGDENSEFDPAIGCSTRSNLAAMVNRRRDLVKGRGSRYIEAERASNIVSQYRAGKGPAGNEKLNHGQ